MSKLIVKIHKTYFVFIVLLCWCFYGFSQHKKPYVLSSGPQNENYHNTGNYLEKLLEELYPEYRFKNISSLGSQDNLHLLDTRFSDFAISQRDALLENLYDEENGMKNIEIMKSCNFR